MQENPSSYRFKALREIVLMAHIDKSGIGVNNRQFALFYNCTKLIAETHKCPKPDFSAIHETLCKSISDRLSKIFLR